VETLAQVEALSGLSCTHFQGFLFGKPLSAFDLPAYLLNEATEAQEAIHHMPANQQTQKAG
jgi:EAL domain-containing protein (putative c-di-GMP-specific phosphodiesterase class I)